MLSSGKKLSEKEFEIELAKLNKLEQDKISITLSQDQTTVEEIMDLKRDYDEVKVLLNNGQTLRVCDNNRYWIDNQLYGFNATSTEEGFTIDKDRKVSVNFVGTQHMKDILEFLLSVE